MAIASLSPAGPVDDLVTIDEALAFLDQSGHGVSKTTLNRWIARHHIAVTRRGRKNRVSMSDLLIAQRDEMDRMTAG
uniref:helix-turn-helix domain-containing protein n=1 Tax=Streptomyces tubercidicus TaxID=47759 RepID=UPI0037DD2FC6|nr:helix-turn-helix domain-containing protein [Streptomyces tubercidicus]